jgi:ABC-2 type transport system ATP-binding protein
MADAVIRTFGLTRYFGAKAAVQDLSFEVPRGGVFAFLGLNGSGKTTTIRMLLGLLEPTRGRAVVLGHDAAGLPPAVRARIGYLAESHPLPGWMTVRESERFQAAFYPAWNADLFRAVTGHFSLDPAAKAKDLSRGQRAGLALALTLAAEPELLILDDPALGLDPVARRALLEAMVFVTRRQDRTIFFSSHFLPEVERVADRVAVLDRSVLRCCCPVETFRARVKRIALSFAGPPPAIPPIPGLLRYAVEGTRVEAAVVPDEAGATRRALEALGAQTIEEMPVSLEDAFLDYLGERGRKASFLQEVGGVA